MYQHASPIRYPYLVTVESGSSVANDPHGPDGSYLVGSLLEDVEMIDDAETSITSSDDLTCPYLVIDTNILMGHFNLVKHLYDILESCPVPILVLVIPFVVINELDRLTSSTHPAGTTPSGDVTRGDLARTATTWLLSVQRLKRERGRGAVRYQRWVERLHKEVDKADDRILDCCLYFRETSTASRRIYLWTNDRNLSLLAETNDVPSFGGHVISLENILRACQVETTDDIQSKIKRQPFQAEETEDMAMELDEDLVIFRSEIQEDHLSTSSFSRSSTAYFVQQDQRASWSMSHKDGSRSSSSPSPTKISSSSRSTPIPQTRTLPPPIVSSLIVVITPLVHRLDPSVSQPINQPTSVPHAIDLIKQLNIAFHTVESNITTTSIQVVHTDEARHAVLQCISATRTILLYLQDDRYKRRPRTGEVADALELLAEKLVKLGLLAEGSVEICGLAAAIRDLP